MRKQSRRSALVFIAASALWFVPQAHADTTQTSSDGGKHFLLGTWDCKGHIVLPEDQDNPERVRDTVGRLKVYKKGDLFVERFQNKASTGRTFRSYGWTKYDAKSDSLRRRGVNNYGGWSFAVSPGWDGKQLVWDGELRAFGHKTIAVQEILTRGDNDSLVWELRTAPLDGRWNWKVMYKGWCEKPEANENHGDDGDSDDGDSDDADNDSNSGDNQLME